MKVNYIKYGTSLAILLFGWTRTVIIWQGTEPNMVTTKLGQINTWDIALWGAVIIWMIITAIYYGLFSLVQILIAKYRKV